MKYQTFQVGELANISGDQPGQTVGVKLKKLEACEIDDAIFDGSGDMIKR